MRKIAGWILVGVGLLASAFAFFGLGGPPIALGLASVDQLLALQTQTLLIGATMVIVGAILLNRS